MTAGQAGEMPDWYPLMKAAKYMGVPGWVLMRKPLVWQQWALAMQKAEEEAKAAMGGAQ